MKFGNFGELIKYKREELGLSQRNLASKIGVDVSTNSRYENDKVKYPQIRIIKKYIRCLKIPEEDVKKVNKRYREYIEPCKIYCLGKRVINESKDYNRYADLKYMKDRLKWIIDHEFTNELGGVIKKKGKIPFLSKVKMIDPTLGLRIIRNGGLAKMTGGMYWYKRGDILKNLPKEIVQRYNKLSRLDKEVFIGLMIKSSSCLVTEIMERYFRAYRLFRDLTYRLNINSAAERFILDYEENKFKGRTYRIRGYFTNLVHSYGKLSRTDRERGVPSILNLLEGEKRQKLEDIVYGMENDEVYGRRLAREAAREFVENYDRYKSTSKGWNRVSTSNLLCRFLNGYDIKTKTIKKQREGHGSYYNLLSRIGFYTKKRGISWQEYFLNLLDKDLREQVEDIIYGMEGDKIYGKRLAREAAGEFIKVYNDYKFSAKYTLYNFLNRWCVNKIFYTKKNDHVVYNALLQRIKRFAKKRKISLENYFLNLLTKNLREQIEDIIYGIDNDQIRGRRLAREAAREFVENYDRYKFLISGNCKCYYTLGNFLTIWDVEKKEFNDRKKDGKGFYDGLLIRIQKFAKEKNISWQEYFLNLLDKDLREQVEDIIYGGRVIREEKTRFVEIAKKYAYG